MTADERDVIMQEFMDLEERCDPDPALQPEIWHDQIEAALKKSQTPGANSLVDLLNFGSRALASYLLTSVAPRLSSPMPKSGSSDESSDESNENPTPNQKSSETQATDDL